MTLKSKLWIAVVSQNKSSVQISITSFKIILVNKLSTWRLEMRWSGQKLEILSANENMSYSKNNKIGTKNLVNTK